MAVNVRGVFLGLRHVLPLMLAQRSGSIVINTGSLSSERGLPGTPAYNAAKHAVLGLTRSAAVGGRRPPACGSTRCSPG